MANDRANPKPKRSAETWTRAHHRDADGSSPKKARFDLRNPSALAPDANDDEDDEYLEADVLTRRGNQTKRNAVNIDGFESDSSNGGFDTRAAVKAKEKRNSKKDGHRSKEEGEEDMFADPAQDIEMDSDEVDNGKPKKEVKFADLDEVEDLEENAQSKSGGHVSVNFSEEGEQAGGDSSSDSEVDDDVRAGVDPLMDDELGAGSKKKHAPKLDAFNLNTEKEEGKFDESLNFVRKAIDPDALFDNWMDGTSKKDIRRAKEAHEKRDRANRQQKRLDDAVLTSDLLGLLIQHLRRSETSLEALARLAPKKESKKPRWHSKKHKDDQDRTETEISSVTNATEIERRKTVEAITGATDVLMTRGVIDIHDSREKLARYYKKETGEEWSDPSQKHLTSDEDAEMWEFRWLNASGGEVQGPEPREKMKAWSEAGYFSDGVEFRLAGSRNRWQTDVSF